MIIDESVAWWYNYIIIVSLFGGLQMVCNEIVLGGNSILTIYHKDFNNVSTRKILHDRKIRRCNLEFHQYQVSDEVLDSIYGFTYKRKGLLQPNVCPNPYGDRVCAIMTHYVFDEKPHKIFDTKENIYSLKLSIQDFIEVAEFTEKYTGIEIKKDPMLFGDTLVFSFCNIDIKATTDNGITINNIPTNATKIAVCFKNAEIIVHSELITVSSETSCIDISCKEKWNNHDISVYSNNELLYSRKNLSYFMGVNIETRILTDKEIPLTTIGDNYTLSEYSSQTISSSKKKIDTAIELIDKAKKKIIRLIENETTDTQVTFIKPGEMDKALGLIGKMIESAKGDLWIYDPYFTDKSEIAKSLDWLKIISNCKANKKNIVFFTRDTNKCLDIAGLQSEIESDSYLQDIIRINGKLSITFYQSNSPVHDRFILVRNESSFYGLIMGTSFNSLDRNYYCLSKITGNSAKNILTELEEWLNAGNIINSLEV